MENYLASAVFTSSVLLLTFKLVIYVSYLVFIDISSMSCHH